MGDIDVLCGSLSLYHCLPVLKETSYIFPEYRFFWCIYWYQNSVFYSFGYYWALSLLTTARYHELFDELKSRDLIGVGQIACEALRLAKIRGYIYGWHRCALWFSVTLSLLTRAKRDILYFSWILILLMYILVSKFRFLQFWLLLSLVAPYYSSLPRTVWWTEKSRFDRSWPNRMWSSSTSQD